MQFNNIRKIIKSKLIHSLQLIALFEYIAKFKRCIKDNVANNIKQFHAKNDMRISQSTRHIV